MRSVKFKLKNGKTVIIRSIQESDYDTVVEYLEKFSHDIGAVQTTMYPGRKKPSKEEFIKKYGTDENKLNIAVWDDKKIVGIAMISKERPDNLYYKGRTAGIGLSVLHEYTYNGIGGKILDTLEKWAKENGIKTIKAEIRHKNIPSIINCIKHGFIITGICYNAVYINGKWIHEYIAQKEL